jgi:hypothetical protein
LRSTHEKLTDIEFEFAKQNALSESTQVLKLQFNNFNLIAKHFSESLPKFNEVVGRARDFCVAGSSDGGRSGSRTKEDMVTYIAEISFKIDFVMKKNTFVGLFFFFMMF